jgi:2-polyprenyl-6-methoxyphenol hydroxylase-like FAD-dependent oxidoreductase
MQASMDAFKRLFSNSNPLLGWLRNSGLGLVNNMAPLKNRIMRQAMGLEGDLPKMAKGS